MAVQVLTPPDSSNKLQIAAAIAGNRKSKPNVSIGGMDPVNVFKVWSDRDLGKKQLAQNESEGKLERENRLEAENIRASTQVKTEKMRGQNALDVESARGVNAILQAQAEAQALTQSQIDVEQQTAVNARKRMLESNLSPADMETLPLNEQVQKAYLNAQKTRNMAARSAAVAAQDTADVINNITPTTVRNTTEAMGLKGMVKPPSAEEVSSARWSGRKDYSVNPNASKGSATSEPMAVTQRPPEIGSRDLLNTEKLGAGWATGGLPYGDSHWDDEQPKLNSSLNYPRQYIAAEVTRAAIKQGIEDHIKGPVQVAAAIAAEMAKTMAPLAQNGDQIVGKTYDTAQRVINTQGTIDAHAAEELMTGNAIASGLKAYRNNFTGRTPQEISSTDPQVFLSDMLKGIGLDGDLAAAQKTFVLPDDPAKIPSWAYDGARKAAMVRQTQQALTITADQLAMFRDDRSQAEAQLYRKASAALTPVYSRLAPVQAVFTQQMVMPAAELYLYAKSMMANQQSPPPPNASPIAAKPALELFTSSLNNLGKHTDIGIQLNKQGRSASPLLQNLDGVPAHMDPVLPTLLGITVGDVPEWSINPADFGFPGQKPADASMVKKYFQSLTHPVDQDIFHDESMRLHEAMVAGRKKFVADQQRRVNEQAEKMKLPATGGGGGGGQTSQPSKPQASQPKKPSSGGEKK